MSRISKLLESKQINEGNEEFIIYFKPGYKYNSKKIEDNIRDFALSFAKDFSDDLTGYSHNVKLLDMGVEGNRAFGKYKFQGSLDGKSYEDAKQIIKRDFDFVDEIK